MSWALRGADLPWGPTPDATVSSFRCPYGRERERERERDRERQRETERERMRCEDNRKGKGWKAGLGLGLGQRRSTEGRTLMPSGERLQGLKAPERRQMSSVFRCPYGTASRAVSAPSKCGAVASTQRAPCNSLSLTAVVEPSCNMCNRGQEISQYRPQ